MTDHTAIVARLRTVELDDHERGCQIRCCACTCGFDDAAVLAAKEAADALESLQAELVKTREQAEKLAEALGKANGLATLRRRDGREVIISFASSEDGMAAFDALEPLAEWKAT